MWTFDQWLSLGERLGFPALVVILTGWVCWEIYKRTTGFFGPMIKTGFEKHIDFIERTAKTAESAAETSREQTRLMQNLVANHKQSNENHKELVDRVSETSDKIVDTQGKINLGLQKISTENMQIITGLADLKNGGNGVGARLVVPPQSHSTK